MNVSSFPKFQNRQKNRPWVQSKEYRGIYMKITNDLSKRLADYTLEIRSCALSSSMVGRKVLQLPLPKMVFPCLITFLHTIFSSLRVSSGNTSISRIFYTTLQSLKKVVSSSNVGLGVGYSWFSYWNVIFIVFFFYSKSSTVFIPLLSGLPSSHLPCPCLPFPFFIFFFPW